MVLTNLRDQLGENQDMEIVPANCLRATRPVHQDACCYTPERIPSQYVSYQLMHSKYVEEGIVIRLLIFGALEALGKDGKEAIS